MIETIMDRFNTTQPWYHGSPGRLTVLRTGSTITQNRCLAEVFSHKPSLVSMGEDGSIQHNGQERGFLYRIADPVGAEDVIPHPRTSMQPGQEWLTNREFQLELLGPVLLKEGELLTEEDVELLRRRG